MKYDLVDCKITEEENALSVLTDKRITQQRWLERMVERHDLFYAFVPQSLQQVTTFQFDSYLHQALWSFIKECNVMPFVQIQDESRAGMKMTS